ncbi:ferritin-like domain-containing protein [Alkalicaulis satelles]|uniref:Ferritin-like domain-containing protein n=1 Tax=Alkalicaulis satelles TaxID=2609175 RepID=A0A5M6ZJN6_9PROT|nr:ferritin-like domain-containing protein [Alkalicaulis satelles]KAA5805026.1 ferritin-like domain-containing protein [Alkalicaulis satelles]
MTAPLTAPALSVQTAALDVLMSAGPDEKAACARRVAADWRAGALALPERGAPGMAPGRPARPDRPVLAPPSGVPKRKLGSRAGRFALLHAVAHIEFNAIDLAFDMVARFGGDARISDEDRADFISDWITVGDDEARHFRLLGERLAALGGAYGDLPAHDGLWSAAEATKDDLPARLAIAPMVLEARGLDVTPVMIERLRAAGDDESADALEIIYTEEVAHVAAGRRWFDAVVAAEGHDPRDRFQTLVRQYFRGALKPPFNIPARDRANLPEDWYAPLAGLLD